MMMPPKLWPMNIMGTRYGICQIRRVHEIEQFSLDISTDSLPTQRASGGQFDALL
jgi:hypothetical protein